MIKFVNDEGHERVLDLYFINSNEKEFYASLCFEKNMNTDRFKAYVDSVRERLCQKTDLTLQGLSNK